MTYAQLQLDIGKLLNRKDIVGETVQLFITLAEVRIKRELGHARDFTDAFPTLSDSTPTNSYLTEFYDIYLYGALLHSAPYLKDDERIAVWKTLYGEAMVTANDTRVRR